ncbi:MAG: hypothetical protein JWR10_1493, partial [Rubritepida sp.]|nr:hypothetical protein [Rubritepida sp.]
MRWLGFMPVGHGGEADAGAADGAPAGLPGRVADIIRIGDIGFTGWGSCPGRVTKSATNINGRLTPA